MLKRFQAKAFTLWNYDTENVSNFVYFYPLNFKQYLRAAGT